MWQACWAVAVWRNEEVELTVRKTRSGENPPDHFRRRRPGDVWRGAYLNLWAPGKWPGSTYSFPG